MNDEWYGYIYIYIYITCIEGYSGPASSVSIATELHAGRSGNLIPVEARFSAPVQSGSGAHPASCTIGTGSFPGVKSGRGVTLSSHLLLIPWSWKRRVIPVLPLWTVRPVPSLSVCIRVHFTFTSTELVSRDSCCAYKSAVTSTNPCSMVKTFSKSTLKRKTRESQHVLVPQFVYSIHA
jgi:hypothetical protein